MSIRTVKCPICGTGANVPVGMTNVKCASCSTVWNVNNPAAASATPRSTAPPSASASGGSTGTHQKTLIAGIAGVLVLLTIAGIAIAVFVNGAAESTAEPDVAPEPVAPPQPVAVAPAETEPTYREIDLPESTRRAIYLDYRKLVGSTTEKKVMILKDSPVNKALQSTLGKINKREVTHFALIHKITEDDVMQIVAEGDAKQWPGSRASESDTVE